MHSERHKKNLTPPLQVSNAFENITDARRSLREIKLLQHLKHENVIQLKDILKPHTKAGFNEIYLVYELMDTDLHQIIRSNQPLTDDHTQACARAKAGGKLRARQKRRESGAGEWGRRRNILRLTHARSPARFCPPPCGLRSTLFIRCSAGSSTCTRPTCCTAT